MIQKKQVVSLSEQKLIDCSDYGDCTAGFPDVAFNYIIKNNGIETTQIYPYAANKGSSCRSYPSNIGVKISSFEIIFNDESKMQIAIDTIGPIVVFLSRYAINDYTGGIINNPACPLLTDHVALAVGYGKDPSTGTNYYIVKNSWGLDWGEGGYFRIAMGVNMCGIGLKGLMFKII